MRAKPCHVNSCNFHKLVGVYEMKWVTLFLRIQISKCSDEKLYLMLQIYDTKWHFLRLVHLFVNWQDGSWNWYLLSVRKARNLNLMHQCLLKANSRKIYGSSAVFIDIVALWTSLEIFIELNFVTMLCTLSSFEMWDPRQCKHWEWAMMDTWNFKIFYPDDWPSDKIGDRKSEH